MSTYHGLSECPPKHRRHTAPEELGFTQIGNRRNESDMQSFPPGRGRETGDLPRCDISGEDCSATPPQAGSEQAGCLVSCNRVETLPQAGGDLGLAAPTGCASMRELEHRAAMGGVTQQQWESDTRDCRSALDLLLEHLRFCCLRKQATQKSDSSLLMLHTPGSHGFLLSQKLCVYKNVGRAQ